MAKKKPETVKAYRNGKEKTFPASQWKNMVASGDTYGWSTDKELSKDSEKKDKEIETSQVSKLEGSVKSLTEENAQLKSDVADRDKKILELEGSVKSLTEEVEKLNSAKSQSKSTDKK